jgi:hypothetical protein
MKIVRQIVRVSMLLAALAAHPVWSQTAVDMSSDYPHYALQLANDQVRVYLMTLKPGERTMVRHDHNFMIVTLQNSAIFMWEQGTSDIVESRFTQGSTGFYYGGKTIGMRNGENATYRNVTIEFLDPKVSNYGYQWTSGGWDYGPTGTNLPVDPHATFANRLPLGSATAIDVQLLPDASLPGQGENAPELIVPVTDIDLKAGHTEIQKSSGDVAWIAGRSSKLVNVAGTAVRFAVVVFPPPASN